jgi:type II secretory pathway pseudopilin PulG
LIELLIVMGIISILAALLLPTLSVINKRTHINLARTEMASIQAAILAYQSAYGRLPMPSTAISGDFTFGPSGFGSTAGTYTANNSEMMAILMDIDQLANVNHALNPRKFSFFTATRARSTNDAGLGPDLVLRDPWGNPYIITIDYDYNNRCQDAVYNNAAVSADPASLNAGYKGLFRTPPATAYELAAPIMIWSMGPDGKASKTVPAIGSINADNVLSWSK